MSNQEILSFTQNLKKSEQTRIYRNLYSHMAEEKKKGCQETYKRLVENAIYMSSIDLPLFNHLIELMTSSDN